ncbi:AMP-binding protein [Actinokineospora auranticolor]|uniref:Amino acid adenylation domain-containing protein n=1 Tax=Actinokineospora auranticolor TaxID=155976 RepID=A0A2S6H1A7_9PSEU|nr:AMP-binding protein [Actinokineospora auranticolor]PPK71197.1 amino acid adenylation domain-containing protein [Actinokineospora auranticolor]
MTSPQLFTVHALVHEAAARFGPDIAITDETTELSFADLRSAAMAAAGALRERGVGRGDRVGVCMAKSTEQAVAILGVLLADAVIVPILPGLKHDNIAHITTDSGARLVITDEARADEVRGAAPAVPLLYGTAPATGSVDVLPMSGRTGDAVPQRAISEDLAAIIYSSGSTGRPKGIMVTHRNLWHGAHITTRYLGVGRDDRIGSVLSLNFDYGLNQLWQSLLTGARLCLHELVFPMSFFQFAARQRITVLPVMPVIITRMFDPRLLRSQPEEDLSSVRTVCTSGGPVSDRMLKLVGATFPHARTFLMYGLTEAFRSTFLEPEQLALRPGSIGRAIPDVELLVLDDDLREVAPGERGELVHRGGCVAKGYWNAPAETAKRFRELPTHPGETAVFSGDIVTRDADGYLYFVGRRDAMIKTSGFRVSPTEVEEVACRFPGVDACVAVGVPNVEIGADIALAYGSAAGVDEVELRAFLRKELPSHMVPRHLLGRAGLPSTGNQGKIDRPSVAEMVRDHLSG